MSAVLKFVGGPKDRQMEHVKGVPDMITLDNGVYWLKTFKGRSAIMEWEQRENLAPSPVEGS
jgi:hypothetical protein